MNQEYVELYVCDEIRQVIQERVQELKGVNSRLYTNKLLFILSKLHWKQIRDPNGFANNGAKLRVHVNSKLRKDSPDAERDTLVWLLSSKGGKVSNMIATLEDWHIIKIKHWEVIGVSARSYTFTDAYIDNQAHIERFYAKKDGAFVNRVLERKAQKANHPILEKVLEIYRGHVTLSEEGLRYIEGIYGHHQIVKDVIDSHRTGCFQDNKEVLLEELKAIKVGREHEMLMKLLKEEYYASIGPRNGRIDHNLTNLSRQYRKFILLDGKPMIETDIVNCQPALATGLINSKLKEMYGESFEAEDMKKYERYCFQGQFYEVVAERANIPFQSQAQRERFKKDIFFPEVFYCKNNNWNTPTQIAFRTLFPSADSAIRKLKEKDHRQFAIDLQKMESDVVVHTIFKQISDEGFVALPLHDAIYTNEESTKIYAQQLIRQTLADKYNVLVRFKGENLDSIAQIERIVDEGETPQVKGVIPQAKAFEYFHERIERYIEYCQEKEYSGWFSQNSILRFLRREFHRDHRITDGQRIQLENHLVDFKREQMQDIPWAA